ncbi:MAG: hypothetical protein JWQ34_2600 [Mucilaginibacter sp.]|uniref:hypothetical protein n=1 Tax=Mucilaginibacter sp. TaxID=1882438 RepID=UPI00345CCD5F|nr:hypothetical protein [Mucilaginibacter sp.]
MMTFNEFKELARPEGLPVQLKSLWYDGQGDWARAHAEVDQLSDKASAWVHAYLHRKEGDLWNADYWYSKAGKVRPQVSLEVEWESLVKQFLA